MNDYIFVRDSLQRICGSVNYDFLSKCILINDILDRKGKKEQHQYVNTASVL